MTFRRMIFAALIVIPAAPAFADGEVQNLMTSTDRKKLDDYGTVRKEAVEEARQGGSSDDVATLDAVLARPFVSFSGFDMTGNWQCRTIKLGGLAKLVVYGWFKCRVTDDGSGWMLKKLTGSQRTTGRFYDDGDKRLIYLGALSINDDKPEPYDSGPGTDQVGYAFRTGDSEWRIEFPAPAYESKLDMLEVRR